MSDPCDCHPGRSCPQPGCRIYCEACHAASPFHSKDPEKCICKTGYPQCPAHGIGFCACLCHRAGITSPEALRMRVLPDSQLPQLPQTVAGRLEFIADLLHPPLYCECGCGKIVGEGAPLISKKLARKLLDATPGATASPPSAPRRRGRSRR